ncbi:hypothetical protein Ahy_A06g029563 isoform C [Arachis hypogaea]|uniref:Uncharacterized protein n=1 Tax=Arachis hypogaea TaxID=3818 RepID=A0A445CTW4_ARAHY|nr:hypothetical protein Ahy_A06g029563 isoform C [Arachis hypogaea]
MRIHWLGEKVHNRKVVHLDNDMEMMTIHITFIYHHMGRLEKNVDDMLYTRYNEVYWLEVGMDLAKGLRVLKRDSDVVKIETPSKDQEEQHESLPQYEEQWQEGDEPMLSKGGNDEQLQNNGSIEVLSNPSQAATTISNESPNLGDNNDTQVKSQERQSNPEEVDDRRRRRKKKHPRPKLSGRTCSIEQ